MDFIEAVRLADKYDVAFRRRSYRPASVWLWFHKYADYDTQLVIGEIKRGQRFVQGVVDITPNLVLARDWVVEKTWSR